MKILFTSPIIEHPAAGGPQLRIENSIKALARVSNLYVVSRSTKQYTGGDEAVEFYSSLVESFSLAPSVSNLSNVTNKQLIVEFVDLSDELIVNEPSFFPNLSKFTLENYNLDECIRIGMKYFLDVNILESHPESRKILVFKK